MFLSLLLVCASSGNCNGQCSACPGCSGATPRPPKSPPMKYKLVPVCDGKNVLFFMFYVY